MQDPLDEAIANLIDTIRNLPNGIRSALSSIRVGTSPAPGARIGNPLTAAQGIGIGLQGINAIAPGLRQFTQQILISTQNLQRYNTVVGQQRRLAALPFGSYQPGLWTDIGRSPFLTTAQRRSLAGSRGQATADRNVARDAAQNAAQARANFRAAVGAYRRTGTIQSQIDAQVAGGIARAAQNAARTAAATSAASSEAASGAAARFAASAAGRGALIAGGGVVLGAGTVIATFYAAMDQAAVSARHFAEGVTDSNRVMVRYNGFVGASYAQLSLSQINRDINTSRYTQESTIELIRSVNDMRNSWFKFDVSTQDATNRVASTAARFSGGFGEGIAGAGNIWNGLVKGAGFGDQNSFVSLFTEEFGRSIGGGITSAFKTAMAAVIDPIRKAMGLPPVDWDAIANGGPANPQVVQPADQFLLDMARGVQQQMGWVFGPIRAPVGRAPGQPANPGFGNQFIK